MIVTQKLNPSFSIGQLYQDKKGVVYMLSQVDINKVCLIVVISKDCHDLGNRWREPVKVKLATSISLDEMNLVSSGTEFKRIKKKLIFG